MSNITPLTNTSSEKALEEKNNLTCRSENKVKGHVGMKRFQTNRGPALDAGGTIAEIEQ